MTKRSYLKGRAANAARPPSFFVQMRVRGDDSFLWRTLLSGQTHGDAELLCTLLREDDDTCSEARAISVWELRKTEGVPAVKRAFMEDAATWHPMEQKWVEILAARSYEASVANKLLGLRVSLDDLLLNLQQAIRDSDEELTTISLRTRLTHDTILRVKGGLPLTWKQIAASTNATPRDEA